MDAHDISLDALMVPREAAKFLGFTEGTFRTWRVRGGGPKYRKLGRSVRYCVRDLIAFAESGKRSNTSEGSAPAPATPPPRSPQRTDGAMVTAEAS